MPPRSSAVSVTPFRRLSSRTEQPRALATSSRVSPKRNTTVCRRSPARASPAALANEAAEPRGTRSTTDGRSGGTRPAMYSGFRSSMTSGLGARGARDRGERGSRGHLDAIEVPGRILRDVCETEGLQVVADDRGGQDLGHVERRLPGQPRLVARQLPEVVGVVAGDRAQDGAVAGVVGGEDQRPGAEADVEILEQAGRGLGGALGIAARVDPVADLEPVGARGAGHELPDAAGALPRGRARIEAALDHGQVDEILAAVPARRACARRWRGSGPSCAARPP